MTFLGVTIGSIIANSTNRILSNNYKNPKIKKIGQIIKIRNDNLTNIEEVVIKRIKNVFNTNENRFSSFINNDIETSVNFKRSYCKIVNAIEAGLEDNIKVIFEPIPFYTYTRVIVLSKNIKIPRRIKNIKWI